MSKIYMMKVHGIFSAEMNLSFYIELDFSVSRIFNEPKNIQYSKVNHEEICPKLNLAAKLKVWMKSL